MGEVEEGFRHLSFCCKVIIIEDSFAVHFAKSWSLTDCFTFGI